MSMRARIVGRFLRCPGCDRILATVDNGAPQWPMGWTPEQDPTQPDGVILRKRKERRRRHRRLLAADPATKPHDTAIQWLGRNVECDRCREIVEIPR